MLEIGKALSFAASILSLYALMGSAFFVPGTPIERFSYFAELGRGDGVSSLMSCTP